MANIPKVILLVETSREYGRALLRGIARYSRLHGPWAFYRETGGLEQAIPRLKDWGANGVITRDSRRIHELAILGVPTIVAVHFKRRLDITSIDTNGAKIGEMAAEHLLNRGFQHFGYCGFDDMQWSETRRKSFKERISENGFETYVYKQPKSIRKRQWQQEQRIMADWLKSLPKPIGLMACNDDRGQHVAEACKIAQLKVPDDVAIVGVDNDELVCDLADPPLSSIALNVEKGGYQAAELLDKLMKGEKVESSSITVEPTHVVVRQSTDILAIEDPAVSKAVRFIRENSGKPIQVSEVVLYVAVSRRCLEQRFKIILGRSINKEIKRVRTERISRMLVETDENIGHIALDLGFPGIDHISRYFRAEKGISPQKFRLSFRSK